MKHFFSELLLLSYMNSIFKSSKYHCLLNAPKGLIKHVTYNDLPTIVTKEILSLNNYFLCFQLYIGESNLKASLLYDVSIFALRSRQQTQALINGVRAPVNYLVFVDSGLDMTRLTGVLYVGGYDDVTELQVDNHEKKEKHIFQKYF